MTFQEYQKACLRTWNAEANVFDQLKNCAYGLGEIGEVQGLLKKWEHHGHEVDADEMVKELGDLMFYAVVTLHLIDPTRDGVEDIAGCASSMFTATVQALKTISEVQLAIDYAICAQTTVINVDFYYVFNAIIYISKKLGYSIEQVMQRNIEKLLERYPDGFNEERSRNRTA